MELLDWNQLLSVGSPWAHLVVCAESALDSFIRGSIYHGDISHETVIRLVRATKHRCGTTERLFQEWAAALQFPWYFGFNWDAWEECLGDLEWLPGNAYVFFLTEVELALPDQDSEFNIYVAALGRVAASWATPTPPDVELAHLAVPFRVVFHCEPKNETEVRQRLMGTGVSL